MKNDMILMRLEKMPRLLLEAYEIRLADLRHIELDAIADLVGEVRIDHILFRLLDMLNKVAQA
jgi:hypothetical protein